MGMYLCYIDESGNTGRNLKDPNQPLLVLTALMVPPENIKTIENDIRTLSYNLFGAESRNTDFEFHGDDLYNNRSRYFKKLNIDKRIEIFDALVDIAIRHDCIKVGYVCIDKSKYYGKLPVQQTAFQLVIEKVEERLRGFLNSHCLLIADEQDDLQQRLIDDLDHFKQHGTNFGYKSIEIERIIDSVHFVQSHNNYLMQLTDVICYLIRRGKEANVKLQLAYNEYVTSEESPVSLQEWVDTLANKGQRYFYRTYHRLNSAKAWIFGKDFP